MYQYIYTKIVLELCEIGQSVCDYSNEEQVALAERRIRGARMIASTSPSPQSLLPPEQGVSDYDDDDDEDEEGRDEEEEKENAVVYLARLLNSKPVRCSAAFKTLASSAWNETIDQPMD